MKVIDLRLIVEDGDAEHHIRHIMNDSDPVYSVLGAVELVNDGFGNLMPNMETKDNGLLNPDGTADAEAARVNDALFYGRVGE